MLLQVTTILFKLRTLLPECAICPSIQLESKEYVIGHAVSGVGIGEEASP